MCSESDMLTSSRETYMAVAHLVSSLCGWHSGALCGARSGASSCHGVIASSGDTGSGCSRSPLSMKTGHMAASGGVIHYLMLERSQLIGEGHAAELLGQ